jgi:hypothetical protein
MSAAVNCCSRVLQVVQGKIEKYLYTQEELDAHLPTLPASPSVVIQVWTLAYTALPNASERQRVRGSMSSRSTKLCGGAALRSASSSRVSLPRRIA